jgi:hypothetical protein
MQGNARTEGVFQEESFNENASVWHQISRLLNIRADDFHSKTLTVKVLRLSLRIILLKEDAIY